VLPQRAPDAAATPAVDRRAALLVVCLLGLPATLVCALPWWGDRPSGAITLAPAFALLAFLVTRHRFSRLSLPIVLGLTCVLGFLVDDAGLQLPKTALLFAAPLGIAACALALLRPRPRAAAEGAAADTASAVMAPSASTATAATIGTVASTVGAPPASAAGTTASATGAPAPAAGTAAARAGSVRRPVPLRMQDQRGGADEP
jgi:hypothetical protein